MKFSESKEKELNLANGTIRATRQGFQFANKNLNTLNMTQEEEEEEAEQNEEEASSPEDFLAEQESRLWRELTPKQQEEYMDQAAEEAMSAHQYQKTHRMKYNDKSKPLAYSSRGAVGGRGCVEASGELEVTNGVSRGVVSAVGVAGKGTTETASVAVTTATTGVETAAEGAATAGTGAATGGASVALKVAKSVAEKFKEEMETSVYQEQQAGEKMVQNSANSHGNANVEKSVFAVAGSAIVSLASTATSGLTLFLLSVGGGILFFAVILITSLSILISALTQNQAVGDGAARIVEVALAEDENTDGSKYWRYTMGSSFQNGSATPWCACFVSWCANECGFIDTGVFPKSGSVYTYRTFYQSKNLYHPKEGYTPKEGDLIIFTGDSHIGIVQYVEDLRVITIEGNTTNAVHQRSYALDSARIAGYCTPEYPAGTEIQIPDGMGIYHTYMGWQTITSTSSLQYQLRMQSGQNFDAEGFAKIGDRFVIACTTTYGEVGDYIDFYRENGEVIHAVIGDIKNQNDEGCNAYGHDGGKCVIEYVVDKSTWYSPPHANPGTNGCHPEWNSRVVKAVNLEQNYFD